MNPDHALFMAIVHMAILASQVFLTYLGLRAAARAKKIEVSINGMLQKLLDSKHNEGYLMGKIAAGVKNGDD